MPVTSEVKVMSGSEEKRNMIEKKIICEDIRQILHEACNNDKEM